MNLWPDGCIPQDQMVRVSDAYAHAHNARGFLSVSHTELTLNNYYHKLMRIKL